MSDKPILFSAPMVRALLAGSKTQTRRAITLPTRTASGGRIYERKDMGGWEVTTHGGPGVFRVVGGERVPVSEEPGLWHLTTGTCVSLRIKTGHRLWVRENFAICPTTAWALPKTVSPDPDMAAYYRADFDRSGRPRWKPSIHMPRWASRLTLTVTDVRVQRLQEISEGDARAEGCEPTGCAKVLAPEDGFPSYRSAYDILWEAINGTGSWDANPFVAAYTFTVEHCNIDQARAA